jgi:hypothetical protein|tara:strand:+ start:3118 stop:3393 length:276 start_codon:yes stop_codon:yes gene_type:complete
MITVLTGTECIQFNLLNRNRELECIRVINYHKNNKTGKCIKVKASHFDEGFVYIYPNDVTSVEHENRLYDSNIGNDVDNLINSLGGNDGNV